MNALESSAWMRVIIFLLENPSRVSVRTYSYWCRQLQWNYRRNNGLQWFYECMYEKQKEWGRRRNYRVVTMSLYLLPILLCSSLLFLCVTNSSLGEKQQKPSANHWLHARTHKWPWIKTLHGHSPVSLEPNAFVEKRLFIVSRSFLFISATPFIRL